MTSSDSTSATEVPKASLQTALTGVKLKGKIEGMMMHMQMQQSYCNHMAQAIETVYAFPLPAHAVLTQVEANINGEHHQAQAQEQNQACERYEKNIAHGHSPILVESTGEDCYVMRIGNLLPGEQIDMRCHYTQALDVHQGLIKISIPTTLVPDHAHDTPHVSPLSPAMPGLQQINKHATPSWSVSYPLGFELDIVGPLSRGSVSSPTHAIRIMPLDQGIQIQLSDNAFLDRDLVLCIEGLPLQSLGLRGTASGHSSRQLAIIQSFIPQLPDASARPIHVPALKISLFLDCSCVMVGDALSLSKRLLEALLEGLQEQDEIEFYRYGTQLQKTVPRAPWALSELQRKLQQSIAQSQANMGAKCTASHLLTHLNPQKSNATDSPNEKPETLVLFTNGGIDPLNPLQDQLQAQNIRLFILGVGSATSHLNLQRLAQGSGGHYEWVTPLESAAAVIGRLFSRMRSNPVHHIRVQADPGINGIGPLPTQTYLGDNLHVLSWHKRAPKQEPLLLWQHGKKHHRSVAHVTPSQEPVALRQWAQAQTSRADRAHEAACHLYICHKRTGPSKGSALPYLQYIDQMQAAGWQGMGTMMLREPRPPLYVLRPTLQQAKMEEWINQIFADGQRKPHLVATPKQVLLCLGRYLTTRQRLDATINHLMQLPLPAQVMDTLQHLRLCGFTHEQAWLTFLHSIADQLRSRFSLPHHAYRVLNQAHAQIDPELIRIAQRAWAGLLQSLSPEHW